MKKIKDARLFETMKTFLTEYLPNVRALSPNTGAGIQRCAEPLPSVHKRRRQ